MPSVPMRVGEIWERNTPAPADDEQSVWNRVKVVGQFGGEVTITPADSFGEVVSVTATSLAQVYTCVQNAPAAPRDPDEAALAALADGGSWHDAPGGG